jgi:hypothetical protein
MIPLSNNWSPLLAVDTYRPRFFFKYEWRWHVLIMPILFPVANYYFIGPSYFNNLLTFVVGTLVALGLYWLSVVAFILTVRWTIRHFPGMQQTILRTLVMLITVGTMTVGLCIFYVWTYSVFPATGVRFSWETVWPVWGIGLLFDAFLCIILGMFYTYGQWKQELKEDEQLHRQALQQQYDTLKGQLNPHFLFNALNSLSVLIGEEPKQAEQFVDKMSRVYRYMLTRNSCNATCADQAKGELVSLQTELEFIDLYADLLQIRYNNSLSIRRPTTVSPDYLTRCILPLSLLTLIDNAVKHNVMTPAKPLVITLEITEDGWLQVTNNRQQKAIRLETIRAGLTSLMGRYQLLNEEPVLVEATDSYFRVALPLLVQ